MDLIDRQAALDAIYKTFAKSLARTRAEEVINSVPSADMDLSGFSDKLWKTAYERGKAEAVRHGHWIPIGNVDADGNQYYNCSICECGETHVPRIQVYYCWNCGARMDGEQHE